MTATRARRVLAALVILCGLVACSEPPESGFDEIEVNGAGSLGISVPGVAVTGIVVYFHGMDQKPDVITGNPNHKTLFDPLLQSGYAVVAADAGGSAFGNPESLQDYRELIAAARSRYGVEPMLFVAESMGALAALAMLTEDTARQVKGMVGITPLMGLPPDIRSVNYVLSAWSGDVPNSADPMSWPPQLFAGRAMLLYQSDDDAVIPFNASAQEFATRFGSVAKVDVVPCQGGHVAADCYSAAGVEKWLDGLG